MAILAIEGHPKRGNEVIEILEMLGGENEYKLNGRNIECGYYIKNGVIHNTSPIGFNNIKLFTLEEFLEKFPYKVGDKVQHKGATSCGSIFEVEEMRWEENTVKYTLCLFGCNYKRSTLPAEYLQPYKEETIKESIDKTNKVIFDTQAQSCDIMNDIIKEDMEENKSPKTQADVDKYLQEHPVKNGMNVIDIERCLETDGLKLPENVVINSKGIGSIQFIQWYEKPQYPKTFIEVLNFWHPDRQIEDDYQRCYKKDLIEKFQDLLYARDAYWKIAGEELGLGKPWEPDFTNNDEERYGIYTLANKVERDFCGVGDVNMVLSFPTEEMRDAFYENFKDLINECKELL